MCVTVKQKNLDLAAILSHLTLIFLNKLMMYGVVQQVYGVVSPDSVTLLQLILEIGSGVKVSTYLPVSQDLVTSF